MSSFDNRRHPMTPNYLEYPAFDESAGFDPVPCAPQVIGRIEHHREGEPVRVALTTAGLSLPDGALLYAQPTERLPIRHDWDDQDKCRLCGDRDWYAGPVCTPKQPAEQHPDVTQLVEALERAHMALIGYLPGHRNDITDAAISQCEQVLAPYRKQQEGRHPGSEVR